MSQSEITSYSKEKNKHMKVKRDWGMFGGSIRRKRDDKVKANRTDKQQIKSKQTNTHARKQQK
jgi:hypothetical protein